LQPELSSILQRIAYATIDVPTASFTHVIFLTCDSVSCARLDQLKRSKEAHIYPTPSLAAEGYVAPPLIIIPHGGPHFGFTAEFSPIYASQ
jgi:hypothetical protein